MAFLFAFIRFISDYSCLPALLEKVLMTRKPVHSPSITRWLLKQADSKLKLADLNPRAPGLVVNDALSKHRTDSVLFLTTNQDDPIHYSRLKSSPIQPGKLWRRLPK